MSDPLSTRSRPATHPVFVSSADITVVMLAIDARLRPLAASIEPFAVGADRTWRPAEGALGDIGTKLYELRAGWVLSGAYNSPRTDAELAESAYQGAIRDLVNRALHRVDDDAPKMSGGVYRDGARPARRLFVACLAVAANATIADVSRAADASQIGALLLGMGSIDGNCAASLIVAPGVEQEPWEVELVRRVFPEMKHIDETTIEPRARCRSCDAPVLKAFGACQACGSRWTE